MTVAASAYLAGSPRARRRWRVDPARSWPTTRVTRCGRGRSTTPASVPASTTQFRTVDPKKKVYTGITPYGNPVVGVGMPIIVTYDEPVTRRAEAERRLSVTTTPKTVGSWHWVGDQMVRWRPKTYWRPGTDVVVRSNTVGVRLGEDIWGNDFDRATFSIGESQVSTVDIANHTMTVRRNGQGRPNHPGHYWKAGLGHPKRRQGHHLQGPRGRDGRGEYRRRRG